MKSTKYLNIKGTVLDDEGLKDLMEKSSINYDIKKYSNIDTYSVKRIDDNYNFIEKTYFLLSENIKNNVDIYPAGEWLLDNFYIIEETVKRIKKEMTSKKYIKLPGIANGVYKGFARIYLIASQIVSFRDGKIDYNTLKIAINSYQKHKKLNMDEIWNLWLFLDITIIENIREICEKIYDAQQQKAKANEIIEKFLENNNAIASNKDTNTFSIEKTWRKNLKSPAKITGYFSINKLKQNNLSDRIKFPFIEYMSYKLKRYGKKGISYLNILEEEVNKLGLTVEEAIKKEHFDIANQKVLIGNYINSIREINRINFLMLFEEINGVEEIFKKDPANVYEKMDYKTKEYYRQTLKEISNKTKISEIYIANRILELAKQGTGKKSHIGYYLIDDGYNELIKKINVGTDFLITNKKNKVNRYILAIYLITMLFLGLFWLGIYNKVNLLYALIILAFGIIPASEIAIQLINYYLVKTVKPKIIPKMDFDIGIPKEYSTMVVIPTIINSSNKVKELMHKLEVYYLANKSENLYFTLLGDCTSSQNENEVFDKDVEETGIEEAKRLNKKYGTDIFYFLYRKRKWNSSEKCFLGWERKRGLLCQFNNFLINGVNEFKVNTLVNKNINEIKYVITLDSDTNLVLDSAKQLIGAMAHILNTPVAQNGIVVEGYGMIQPRVGVDLESSRKTFFSKIYAGNGGTDLYANAISDVYQDNFEEGIFTGKGIYDLQLFHNILANEIPENTVLSHDLLEGSYLRCGLASDIILMDGCPAKYNSYMARLHRWIRGDWQIINWLNKSIKIKNGSRKANPLNKLSKFKILDNLRRSLVPVFALTLIIIGTVALNPTILLLGIITAIFPSILDLGNYIVFKKNTPSTLFIAKKNIVETMGELTASIIRAILEFIFLPNKAFKTINAICKSLYRLKISKQNLLEWVTAEEAEKQAKNNILSYYKAMKANVILGILGIIFGVYFANFILLIFSLMWAVAPYFACEISKANNVNTRNIKKEDKEYLKTIGEQTWEYFKDNINKENNYLPPDNYQEDRKEKVAHRTSSTNIGLRLISGCIGM